MRGRYAGLSAGFVVLACSTALVIQGGILFSIWYLSGLYDAPTLAKVIIVVFAWVLVNRILWKGGN